MNANNRASKAARRQLFPEKLWDLVHKPDSGAQWSKDGTCVEVERNQLEKSFGGKFRSKNFDSFIRQLHFYGFRKAGNSYFHEKFQQNRFQEVLSMKRKYSNMALSPITNNATEVTMINAISQTSISSGLGSSSGGVTGSGTECILPVIKKKRDLKAKPVAVQPNDEGALDLTLKKSNKAISTVSSSGNRHMNGPESGANLQHAIDYSKANRRRLMLNITKSPSKTLSRKNHEQIVIKIGS